MSVSLSVCLSVCLFVCLFIYLSIYLCVYSVPHCFSLYRLVSVEDRDVNFWEVLQDFAEKMFLIPTIPEGTMGLVSLHVGV